MASSDEASDVSQFQSIDIEQLAHVTDDQKTCTIF